jgi:hypothetical protein
MWQIWGQGSNVQGAGFGGGKPSAGDVFDNSVKMLRFKRESFVYARGALGLTRARGF